MTTRKVIFCDCKNDGQNSHEVVPLPRTLVPVRSTFKQHPLNTFWMQFNMQTRQQMEMSQNGSEHPLSTDSPSHSDDCATLYNRTAQILSSPAKCFVRLYMTHSSVNTSCMEFNIDKRRCLKMPPLRSVRKDTLTNMNEMLPLTRGAMPHKTCFFDPYTCRKCWLHCPCHEKSTTLHNGMSTKWCALA